jgi:hypothetical protein
MLPAGLTPDSAFLRLDSGLAAAGCSARITSWVLLCVQQRPNLLLNLHEADAAIFVKFLSRIAGVLDLPVLSNCVFNRLDLLLQLFDFLGNGGRLHMRSVAKYAIGVIQPITRRKSQLHPAAFSQCAHGL